METTTKPKTITLYKDVKCTVWERRFYTIEADTIDQAVEILKSDDDIESDCFETLIETSVDMEVEYNDGASTVEIYNEGGILLFENGA